jgi:hypothetical protein
MDKNKNKNKNKNKINVLRSSRIIKIKSIGNINYSLSTTYTSLSDSQPEESVEQLLQQLLTQLGTPELQDSDKQTLSKILQNTSQSIKRLLQQNALILEILKVTKNIVEILQILQNLSPTLKKELQSNLKTRIAVYVYPPNASNQLKEVLKKLFDYNWYNKNQEIQRILLLIVYSFYKEI